MPFAVERGLAGPDGPPYREPDCSVISFLLLCHDLEPRCLVAILLAGHGPEGTEPAFGQLLFTICKQDKATEPKDEVDHRWAHVFVLGQIALCPTARGIKRPKFLFVAGLGLAVYILARKRPNSGS